MEKRKKNTIKRGKIKKIQINIMRKQWKRIVKGEKNKLKRKIKTKTEESKTRVKDRRIKYKLERKK